MGWKVSLGKDGNITGRDVSWPLFSEGLVGLFIGARQEGIEPPTGGFGDRCSTN